MISTSADHIKTVRSRKQISRTNQSAVKITDSQVKPKKQPLKQPAKMANQMTL
ncbi:hypothetical protein ACFP1H_02525 [Secundilactobacillus hailunensis]|uniref:Uncharacterized protein n=1 Tax=Secundilactobacillus hailunensis TaxID=2559923 RepID=A0ABW1T720_9LACO|nr:hypothetical protein [Secundilactobacillus hailunensis]